VPIAQIQLGNAPTTARPQTVPLGANSQAVAAIGAMWLLFAAIELLAGRPKSRE
jgi:hypothetical protein